MTDHTVGESTGLSGESYKGKFQRLELYFDVLRPDSRHDRPLSRGKSEAGGGVL